jgi:hypothetical protein
MKREVANWTSLAQEFRWQITAPAAGDYSVNILIEHRLGAPVSLSVSNGSSEVALSSSITTLIPNATAGAASHSPDGSPSRKACKP